MADVRKDEIHAASEALKDGLQTIHISGEPGVGKTTFLEDLSKKLSESYEVRTLTARESNDTAILLQDLLLEIEELVGTISKIRDRLVGGSIGAGGISVGASLEDRRRDLRKLGDLASSVSNSTHLIFCIDDVHKLNEGNLAHVRGFLQDMGDNLPDNIHLVTAGQMAFPEAELEINLGMFTKEETQEILENRFPDIDQETLDAVHSHLDGHPYYIGLITESGEDESILELPEEDYYEAVEESYLRSLTADEEEFLRQTAPLVELEESICSAVLGMSKTEARRTLEALGDKVVVRELGRGERHGEKVYKVHDLFRRFLYDRLEDPESIHRSAFRFYSNLLVDEVEGSEAPPLDGFAYGTLAGIHLNHIYNDNPSVEEIRKEIDGLEYSPRDRFKFLLGFLTYLGGEDLPHDVVLQRELEEYSEWLENVETDDEEQELSRKFFLLVVDMLRAQMMIMSSEEDQDAGIELLNDVIGRIREEEFEMVQKESGDSVAQFLRDLLEAVSRISTAVEIDENTIEQKQLEETYTILERYGLERDIAERFVEMSQEFVEDIDPGDQMEQFVENRLEEAFDDIDESGVTRSVLLQMQTTLISEVNEWIQSFGSAAMGESHRLMSYIREAGEILEEAENPFFVTVWYSIWINFFSLFAPDSKMVRELERRHSRHEQARMEYEAEVENPLVEIEEFDIREFELPDLFRADQSSEEG